MRAVLRLVNVLAALVCLVSGAAVLASHVSDAGYRAHHGDSLWVLVAYVGFYAWVVLAFARDDRHAPRLAVAKAAAAYVFIATFVVAGPLWMARTPGRYVYQLFDWGTGAEWVLIAYVLLGRGVWNTVNAMVFTAPWWTALRRRRPLLGRLVTAIPLAIVVGLVWTYRELLRLERATFSDEARVVAAEIAADIDCATLAARQGRISSDVRERGGRRYDVQIRWDCRDLQVLVRDPDGRLGNVRRPRPECCPDAGP